MKKKNFTQIPNALINDSSVPPNAKALYMVLASRKRCFMSYEAIMKVLNIKGRATVKKLIDILQREGWIDYVQGHQNKSNRYKPHWNKKCTNSSSKNELPTVQKLNSINTSNTNTPLEDDLEERTRLMNSILERDL
ncbi:helix-turn-helix domain-containing protein [Halobacteriovorax sp. ZH5_bin.2]|uniref:helix-turn-helix domain-containing protein n=1 Tax=Halobacteriovorax sp. ZH5_bin.2 TaxID=3157727 RepID=UPI0037229C08